MKHNQQVTDDELSAAIKESNSVSEAIRKLGRSPHGSNHKHYSVRVRNLGLDTSHFDRRNGKSGREKSASELLVNNPDAIRRTPANQLRRALMEVGIKHCCLFCGIPNEWHGRPLTLEVDHIDGDWKNNEQSNLRFLCPNCHQQTPTHGTKKFAKPKLPKVPRITKTYSCSECDGKRSRRSGTGLCSSCYHARGFEGKTRIDWPPVQELLDRLEQGSMIAVAEDLGISPVALKKRIKKYGVWTPRQRGPFKLQN